MSPLRGGRRPDIIASFAVVVVVFFCPLMFLSTCRLCCSRAIQRTNGGHATVATLTRILVEKGFLRQINEERPFRFQAIRSFEDASGNLLTLLVKRVFGGSREELLVRLMEQRKLTPKERAVLEKILSEKPK